MKGKNTKRQNRRRKLATALILGAMGAVAVEPARAQDLQQTSDARVEFNIAAQPLTTALSEFARQAGVNTLYFSEDLSGLSAQQIRGSYTRQQALDLLLAGSGYNAGISGGNLVLAQEQSSRPQRQSAASGAETRQAADAAPHSGEEEIVVTGTRIRGVAPAGAHIETLTRADIEQTGRSTVQDVLQTLSQNFPGSQNDTTQLGSINSGRNLAFASTVDLRGLGADATLTLLNGRRLAPAGFGNFVDISTIPLAAVERIDVLADGASATYGSDAVAGVVNIILRRDFEGAETSLRYSAATQGDPVETNFSQLFGAAWSGGSTMVGYEYRNRGALAAADRRFSATSDLRPWGGSNFSSISSNPGNITRIGATNVVLAIPERQDGRSLSGADLLPGIVNYRPFNEGNSLIPRQTLQSIFASVRQDVTPQFEVFADFISTRRKSESDRFQNNVTLVVPETNAYRVLNNLFPNQGPIRIAYNMGDDLGPTHYETMTEAYSIALGGSYDLTAHWRLDASVSLSRNEDTATQHNVFGGSALLAPALASGDLNAAFNPFGDGAHSPAAALQGLTFDDTLSGESQMLTYAVKADGPIVQIWGGQARLAVGAERREEDFSLFQQRRGSSNLDNALVAPASRTTDALFGEIYLPLVGEESAVPLVRALDISMSIRYERASDFGSATTPKIGMNWSLSEDFAIRGSWGESFKAPQFQQLFGGIGGTIASVTPVLDPFATDGSTGILLLAGTNANLRPETAENWTAGFDYIPAWFDGFALHATYYDIDFANRISDPGNVAAALANPSGYEGFFFRNPSQAQIDYYLSLPTSVSGSVPPDGIEVIWDGRLTNLASLRVRGVDFSARYDFDSDVGQIQVFASASLMLQYTVQSGPSNAPINALDTMFNPVDLRARAGVAWTNEPWSASLAVNYVDEYTDAISTPNRRVAAWTTWDARLTHDFSAFGDGAQVTLSAQNLFDEDPPFANNPIGYAFDPQGASPVGRSIAIEVRQRW